MAQPSAPLASNHRLSLVYIVGVTDPDNDEVAMSVTSVTQDEPVNGLGDGDTSPDAVLQGGSVLVRSERGGGRNGRVYRIGFSAIDAAGSACTGAVAAVWVPHDRGSDSCVDDGQVYDSLRP